MPRYGEASVVGKAWQDDHPIASAVAPAAAFGLGATQLKAGIRPNPKGAIASSQNRLDEATTGVTNALRKRNAAQRVAHTPVVGAHPLHAVGTRWKGKRGARAAGKQLKEAESSLRVAESTLSNVKRIAPKTTLPKVRAGRAAIGGTLAAAGGYGLYRRFVAPRPGGPPNGQMG